ncbi:efflux RND transporter periplasmic adaptor subunit [Ferrimonas balearica]|uniref:efflux RND transporter periplasmic adaptor subunit n=1 Tax=Ferrimonas balearica TaxID=44012 RepID=UPI001C991C2F|nr:efflux RND transporter periplasmic adaptor subunit [Ferrimonas balearica]MBY5993294.1 efflux RND transporter periplasmic adaptor subunit [Ferrimonas balearica]
MFKRSALVVGGLIALLLVLGGIKYKQVQAGMAQLASFAPPPATVAVVDAVTERWQPEIAAVGTLTAKAGIELSPEVGGLVQGLYFRSGHQVNKGDLLLQLDDAVEQANLESFRAQAELAKVKHDRNQSMFERRNISETEFDESSANLKVALASVAQTEATIAKKAVRAPFSGVLGIRQVDLGQYVKAGDTLVSLQDVSSLYTDFSVPEHNLPDLYVGQTVLFNTSAYPGVDFEGKVLALDAKVDENTRNIAIRAEVPNAEGKLTPGMYADIRLLKRDAIEPVTVPSTAVTYSPFGDAVFVVKADEQGQLRAYRQYIKISERRGDTVAIASGLEAGEQVVSAGTQKLANEAPVQLTQP